MLTEVEWKLTSPLSDQQSFVTKLSQSVTSQNPVATTLKPIIWKWGVFKQTNIKHSICNEVEWKLTSPLSDQPSFVTKLSQSVASQNPVATALKPIIWNRGIFNRAV